MWGWLGVGHVTFHHPLPTLGPMKHSNAEMQQIKAEEASQQPPNLGFKKKSYPKIDWGMHF